MDAHSVGKKQKKQPAQKTMETHPVEKKQPATDSKHRMWINLIGPILVAIFSVGGTLLYQHLASQPKLSGRIITAAFGQIDDTRIVKQPSRTITLYVYLANSREIPVSVVDYTLEILVGDEWKKLDIIYRKITNFKLSIEKGGGLPKGSVLIFPSDENFLTHNLANPITRSQPRGGLLLFISPMSLDPDRIDKLRLKIFDGYGKTYEIVSSKNTKHDPRVLLRLAPDIKLEIPKNEAS